MKTSIIALSIFAFMPAPAMADDAFWPANPAAGTPFNGGGINAATAAEHKAHYENLRNGIIANGGCNADALPYWVAQGCSGGVFTNADGGDNGSTGDSSASSGGAAK